MSKKKTQLNASGGKITHVSSDLMVSVVPLDHRGAAAAVKYILANGKYPLFAYSCAATSCVLITRSDTCGAVFALLPESGSGQLAGQHSSRATKKP